MSLTTIILLVLALYVAQLFLQETSRFGFDVRGIVGNRDRLPGLSVMAGRLERAKNNLIEAMPLFLALALLTLFKSGEHGDGNQGALLFLIARVVYVPAYASGIPMFRSLAWIAGMAGMGWMAWLLIQG